MKRRTLEQYCQDMDVDQLAGERRTVGSNAPLLLRNSRHGILVLDGHVDVFAVRFENGVVVGPRHSLFRATAGEILFGLADPDEQEISSDFALMAVGVSGTIVLDRVSIDACRNLEGAHLAALLDRFIAGLCLSIPRTRPPEATTVLEPAGTIEIYRNMPAFGPTRRPLWVSSGPDHQFNMYGDDNLAATVVPVSSSVWVKSSSSHSVSAMTSSELVQRTDWWIAVQSFLCVYGRLLHIEITALDYDALKRQKTQQNASREALGNAIADMAATVRSDIILPVRTISGDDALHTAFLEVARYLHIENTKTPRKINQSQNIEAVENLALTYRLRIRKVILRQDWWRHDSGPLLCYTEAGRDPLALLPVSGGGYQIFNPVTGERLPCDQPKAEGMHGEAVMLYRPLPKECRRLGRLVNFIVPTIRGDLRRVAYLGVMGGLIAAFTPVMTGVLIESILPRADIGQHIQIVLALVLVAFGGTCFEVVKGVALLRIEGRADLHLQAALFDRILRMPAGFFRQFSAGDLADRVLGIQAIRQTLTGTTVQGILGITFSTFSLLILLYYNWKLALIAGALVLLAIGLTIWLGLKQLAEERARIFHQGQAEGFVVQLLTGIAKLRVAAAENRAYARWATYFTRQKKRFVRAQYFANIQDIFQSVFPVIATGVIFIAASVLLKDATTQQQLEALVSIDGTPPATPMSTGDFIAFNSAFGQFLAAMTALATSITKSLVVVPMFERLRPIVEAEPEVEETDKAVETLRGGIEINHVSFRYSEGGPLVLNDLSFNIEPNEFVAIVGSSGSGKSTLVRLLLGFERCEAGEVLYDGTPISSLDMSTVRQQVRVVMQNGQLTSGSIFSNIVGASTLTQDDAWHAARLAGLDKDIEAMPMGMHTVLLEGVNTLSGGQRQRLMIARALAHRPNILLLDEPTSALDNTTQNVVMASLSHLNATRIVIAHRLSTIRSVDRVLVMDQGRLVQQGTFEELIAHDGAFADLAKRQLV